MQQLQRDPVTRAERLLAPHRALRLGPRPDGCPFCPGNEHTTPAELARLEGAAGESWRARSFPNLFPMGDVHEVLVPTPRHVTSMRALDEHEWVAAVTLWLDRRAAARARADQADGYLHLFVNDGRGAGASQAHTHAQLVLVPRTEGVERLLAASRDEADCGVCAALTRARGDDLIVDAGDGLTLAAHPVPRTGHALLLAPDAHATDPAGPTVGAAAPGLARALRRAVTALPDGDWNLWLVADEARPCHWYVELLPRATATFAGVELGLGIDVSIIEPRDAAVAARERLTEA